MQVCMDKVVPWGWGHTARPPLLTGPPGGPMGGLLQGRETRTGIDKLQGVVLLGIIPIVAESAWPGEWGRRGWGDVSIKQCALLQDGSLA